MLFMSLCLNTPNPLAAVMLCQSILTFSPSVLVLVARSPAFNFFRKLFYHLQMLLDRSQGFLSKLLQVGVVSLLGIFLEQGHRLLMPVHLLLCINAVEIFWFCIVQGID